MLNIKKASFGRLTYEENKLNMTVVVYKVTVSISEGHI